MPKVKELGIQPKNPFWVLDDSDEDETVEKAPEPEPEPEPKPEPTPVPEPVPEPEPEAEPKPEPEPEPEPVESKVEKSSYFRTWIKNEEDTRFASDELKNNIFSSPFSKKRITKEWGTRPRFRDDDDNWVSIRWNQPQFEDDVDTQPVIYEERVQDFPSMLTRSTRNIFVEETITPQDEISAVVWAERIKKSLEKAEISRAVKKEEKEIHMSFFRSPLITKQES